MFNMNRFPFFCAPRMAHHLTVQVRYGGW